MGVPDPRGWSPVSITLLTAVALMPLAAAVTALAVYVAGAVASMVPATDDWEGPMHRYAWPTWRAYRHRGRHRRRSTHARHPMLPPATVHIRFLADPDVRRRLSPDWRRLLDFNPEARWGVAA